MTTVASEYTPPTKAANDFCGDATAVSVCAQESRSAAALTSDQCFEATGLYAVGLTECSAVKVKANVTVACKTALGGASSCFGLAPASPSPAADYGDYGACDSCELVVQARAVYQKSAKTNQHLSCA